MAHNGNEIVMNRSLQFKFPWKNQGEKGTLIQDKELHAACEPRVGHSCIIPSAKKVRTPYRDLAAAR